MPGVRLRRRNNRIHGHAYTIIVVILCRISPRLCISTACHVPSPASHYATLCCVPGTEDGKSTNKVGIVHHRMTLDFRVVFKDLDFDWTQSIKFNSSSTVPNNFRLILNRCYSSFVARHKGDAKQPESEA